MTGKPSHIEIGAPNIEQARSFWGKLFGWKFEPTDSGVQVRTDSLPGGIHSEPDAGIQIFFEVDDLDLAAKSVVELGGEVDAGASETANGRYLHSCRDNQGIPFGLHESRDA